MTSSTNTALAQWALDREIVLSRVISARRDVVFSVWADAKHLPNWFGPAGFEIETKEIDIRVGGLWRFDMIAPNGRRYPNRMQFRRIEPPTLIEIDHGADDTDDPGRFRTTITFDEQSDGKTVITLRQLHPTKAQRDAGIGFGAVEYGYQTLEKLARHVEVIACIKRLRRDRYRQQFEQSRKAVELGHGRKTTLARSVGELPLDPQMLWGERR